MPRYEFTVYMLGEGNTPEEAWEGAVDHVLANVNSFSRTDPLPEHKELEEDELQETCYQVGMLGKGAQIFGKDCQCPYCQKVRQQKEDE